MRQELRALLEDASLLTIGSAIVLGLLLVNFLQSLGDLIVGLIEKQPDEAFDGGPLNSFVIGGRIVYYGPTLGSALALAGAILVLALLSRWLNRPRADQ
jgi:hypothetical protein